MLPDNLRHSITALIRREVIPAIGCTEPVAVALAVARATEALGTRPDHISVSLSGNVLKNAMGVGIPGTGMIGLPIAVALGAIVGKSELGLEVLRDVNPDAVEIGKKMIADGAISVSHDPDAPSKLHITADVSAGADSARAVISGGHTRFTLVERNYETIFSLADAAGSSDEDADADASDPELNLATVWDYAMTTPLSEMSFILQARDLNRAAARTALASDMGHSVGSTILNNGRAFFGDTTFSHMIAYTSAACDARMAGEKIPVMSNSGSGNQGITITMPVVAYAEEIKADEPTLIRALALAHLTSIYIKQSLGRLSALCGCVVASTGASCALVYLMGGDFRHATFAVKNMIANLTGMICDGAKPACSLKIASGVSTAILSSLMAMNDRCVTSAEGIVDDDVDVTIHNLTSIGRDAMNETDRLVLSIMSRH